MMKKRIFSVVLCLCMALVLLPAMSTTVQASTNGHTQAEAVQWAKDRADEHWEINDGSNMTQCTEFVWAYYEYLLGYHVGGHAYHYLGDSYGACPSGWTRPDKSTVQPGDIVIWDQYENPDYGHIGVVISVEGGSATTAEANAGYARGAVSTYNRAVSGISGIIRPDWPSPQPTTPSYDPSEFEITTSNNGDVELQKYKGSGGAVSIPDGVTSIGNSAFSGCSSLTSVFIPDSVISIGYYAFRGCSGLTSMSIPGSVTSIADQAFYGCSGLTSMTIPSSVTSIGRETFYRCTSLTSVSIPSSVTSIGDDAFNGCNSLISVSIGNGVTSIGNSAFSGCSSLTSVSIPNSVTSIGASAFNGCTGLTSVSIPNSVTSIGGSAFYGCDNLTSVIVPNSVTSIGDRAFGYCTGLTSVTIGNSVTSIGDYAFSGCSSLTNVTIPGSVTSIGRDAFYRCYSLMSVTIQNGVTSIGYEAFGACTSLTNVNIPGSVTDIGGRAFDACISLTQVAISSGVTSIGDSAFNSCYNLTNVTIPGSVTSIGSSAFAACHGLTSVIIGNGVTSIGNAAFSGCDGLSSVTIGKSVTSIGGEAFSGCTGLTSITIPNSVISIGDDAFSGCLGLTSATIGNSVTSIGTEAFYYCYGLTDVTIPNSVTSIGNSAFAGCDGLKDVYYDGSETQWKAIQIGYQNNYLTNAIIHYNSAGMGGAGEGPVKPEPDISDGSEDISKIKINGKSIQSLFSKSSTVYDNDLALFAANLSARAEDRTGDGILNYYRSLGWPDEDKHIFQYGGDRAYSIACAKLSKDENLLVITARGSQTLSEFIEDGFSFGHRDFFGYTTNDVIYDYEEDIMTGLNLFLTNHEYLMGKNLKVLITGHSLGGAAANLNAARFTLFKDYGAWWSNLTEQSDIYCYTFGAINSLSNNSTVKNGFENIHNIYNLLDSFGPNRCGNRLPSGLGRGYGKFGHMEMYSHNYETSLYIPLKDSTNHLIENYIDSLTKGYVSCKANSALTIYGGGGWCPVDLKIYLETTDGPMLVGSITDNQIDEIEHPMVGLRVDGDKKYFYFPDDGDYIIELEGTDIGIMTYFVQDMNAETGEPIDDTGIVYQQVQLADGKQFYSDVRVDGDVVSGIMTERVPLYVLGDNGQPELKVLPDDKGTEVPLGAPDAIYTISFDTGDSSINVPTMKTNTDGKLSTLPAPTRSGYTFDGWFTAASGGDKITTETVFECNTTVYAHWTRLSGSASSGGSSGGGSALTTYVVEIPSVANGTITVNPKSAVKGSTVTITATPNAGYRLTSLTVSDSSGKAIALTDNGNGKYTFTMPSGKVTVDATFQPVQVPETSWNNPFTDIAEGQWYYEAVRFVHENGLMNGYGDNIFAPNANLSRAMLAQILYNKEGRPAVSGSNIFSDVVSSAWYSDAVSWAAERGIVTGYSNGRFGPDDNITREQLAVMLWRYAGEPTATDRELHFNDANVASSYAFDALCWATENSIINGKGNGVLDPKGQATRAQVAQMLMNYLRK